MEWNNENGWFEYQSIEQPIYEHYDDRELFDENGNWVATPPDGYDFKLVDNVGYIHHWSNIMGDWEYILKVPKARFHELIYDYFYEEGRKAMEEYDEWVYKDGVYIATRIV